jgi:autotransporter-associated beta strand protein
MKPNSKLRLNPAFAALTCAALGGAVVHAATFTWDGTNNAPWSDARWSDGVNSAINWVNGGTNDAVVNSGDVWSPIQISANSLTIGDGVGDPNSASARFATNNAFWGITTITINSDGYLAGSANTTSHLLTVNLNGGTIGGGDNGGDAAFYGVIALHGPVNVNGGAVTSTISTTGGGVLLVGPTAGTPTEFNVADGAAAVDLLVSGNLVHKPFGDSEALLKTGAGKMVLSGTNAYQGPTTVSGGILSITSPFLHDSSTITIDAGAQMDLDFTGYDSVGSLVIDGETVGNGVYNKDHPTHGTYFTGSGSLVVGGGFSAGGSWVSTVSGDWSTASNWESAVVANGPDSTATFSAGSGGDVITATLDSNRTLGNLAFSNASYTITGANTLTLESSGTPAIGVATACPPPSTPSWPVRSKSPRPAMAR